MTRDDVKQTFPDATPEQISALLNIHSADIGKVKGASQPANDRVAALETALATAKSTIENLEKGKTDHKAMKDELERYKKADEDRKASEEKAKADHAMEKRFTSASEGRTFVHDYVKKGVMGEFATALQDEANQGKADKDIFEALTKDKGYFSSMNPPPSQSMGTIGQDKSAQAHARAIMGLSPDTK